MADPIGAIGATGSPAAASANEESRSASRQAIREAARGLEGALLKELLTSMERAQLEEGLFGKGPGSGAIQSAFELLLTEALGESEPFGVAEQIADQLTKPGLKLGPETAENPDQARDFVGKALQDALDLAREGGISFGQVPIYSDEGSSSGQGDR